MEWQWPSGKAAYKMKAIGNAQYLQTPSMAPLPTSDTSSFFSISTSDRSAPPVYTTGTTTPPELVDVTRLQTALRTAGSALIDVLTAFWICLVFGIPGLILLVALIV